MMLKNKWFKFSLVLFLLPLVCILVTYNKLPAQVATHFDFHGTPDGYMNKFLGLYGVWGFMLVLHIFCAFMTFKDPKKSNIPDKGLRIVLMICPLICLMVTLLIITYSLGYRFDMTFIMNIVIGFIFIILGNDSYISSIVSFVNSNFNNLFSIFLFISLLFIQTPTNTKTIITYLRKKES